VRPLPLRPLPIPTEPLTDFLERLAGANGYGGRELWRILDKGQIPHAQVLTNALNGHSLPAFSGPVEQGIEIPVELFGLQPADFTHMRRRWCPVCIQAAAWFRPVWRLKVATICSEHRVRLLQACPKCRIYPNVQAILAGICECGAHFAHAAVPAIRREALLARALDESLIKAAALDLGESLVRLSTAQLIRMICYVGRFIEGPQLRRPGKIRELEDLSVASSMVAGTATLLTDWPATFWHCLERFVEAAPHDASVRRVFGPLYHVLYKDLRDSAFQFMRNAFELFLLEHWRGELCGRHRLFNAETIIEHRHQGLARVARAAGLDSKRLRRMVHQDRFPANQFNPNSTRRLVTVDKDVLARLLPNPNDYLDLRAAARLLGFKRTRLRQLVAHGVILADAKPDFRRSNRWHFRRSEIEIFLNEIRQGAMPTLPVDDTVTLTHALQYWRVAPPELGELMRVLKRGEMAFVMPLNCRLSDLTFGEGELRAWLARTRATTVDWVSVPKASELLGLKEQVVYELVAKNFLVAEVVSKSGRAIRRISLPSLQQFKQTYVSAAELAQQKNTSAAAMIKCIAAKPVTGPKIDGGRQYFYRRSELDWSVMQGMPHSGE
jgi:hypothetical protein